VICWEGLAHDRAASVFGGALASAVKTSSTELTAAKCRAAFDAACAAVSAGGAAAEFALVDPHDPRVTNGRVHGLAHTPIAAGVPRLLLPTTGLDDARAKRELCRIAGSARDDDGASVASEGASSVGGRSQLSAALTRLGCADDDVRDEHIDEDVTDESPVYRSLGAVEDQVSNAARSEAPIYRSLGPVG